MVHIFRNTIINNPHKLLSNKKSPMILPCQNFHLPWYCDKRQAKIINDMANVNKKSEKITPFGELFFSWNKMIA